VGRLETLAGDVEDGMTVAFGSPERGLPEILGIDATAVESSSRDDGDVEPAATDLGFDLWLNTVPHQGSEVIRTEEALFATLACLSLRV